MKIFSRALLLLVARACAFDYASSHTGVGFELTLDYGVASVYFANGSYADIARIEGGASFRHAMRSACSQPSAAQLRPSSQSDTQTTLWARSVRDYLPPCLGGRDPFADPYIPMLISLKAATEAYLEHSVYNAQVVVPYLAAEPQRQAFRDAASALSFSMPRSSQPSSDILAAQAHGLVSPCPDPDDPKAYCSPPRFILAIEYTGAALSAAVILDELQMLETARRVHEVSLGANALAARCNLANADPCIDELASTLQKLMTTPLEDGSGAGMTPQASELVLYGEYAADKLLDRALRRVLKEQYQGHVKADMERQLNIPPLYAASRGLAKDCTSRLNFNPPDRVELR